MEYTLKLTEADVKLLLEGVGVLPINRGINLFLSINDQIIAQSKKSDGTDTK